MKKAFTMLELVFVIVIVGILAAVMIPRFDTNPVHEAKIQLVGHIRYAQHLAIVDDKFDANTTWYKNVWQIAFDGNAYSIVADNNTSFAKDPLNGNNILSINLSDDYDTTITFDAASGCAAQTDISFDFLGRPIIGDINTLTSTSNINYLTTDCRIILANGSETTTITISPETGYTR